MRYGTLEDYGNYIDTLVDWCLENGLDLDTTEYFDFNRYSVDGNSVGINLTALNGGRYNFYINFDTGRLSIVRLVPNPNYDRSPYDDDIEESHKWIRTQPTILLGDIEPIRLQNLSRWLTLNTDFTTLPIPDFLKE